MSRIGRMPITLPQNVTVEFDDKTNEVIVKGALGTLRKVIDARIKINIENNQVTLTRESDIDELKAKHGLYRALINNMVTGVSQGFVKKLTFNGVGYKLQKTGDKLVMNLGLSHSVSVQETDGVTFEILSPTEIAVKGIDKEKVGQVAAKIRAIRPVEPYHLYGIRYSDEVVFKKVVKSGKK